MSHINKLVVYRSMDALAKHAANYPNLVNFNPFTNTGNIDDGYGHFASVTFCVLKPDTEFGFPVLTSDTVTPSSFDNIEMVGCSASTALVQE